MDRFFYLPWFSNCLTRHLESLSIDIPQQQHINPCHFKYFTNLSRLTLKTCSLDTLISILLVFSTHNRPKMKQLKYLSIGNIDTRRIHNESIVSSMNKFGYGPEKIQLSELEEINLYESIQILNEISLCELKQFTFFFISDKNSSDDTKHHLSSVENSEYSQRDPLVLILQVERIFLDFSQVFQEITYL